MLVSSAADLQSLLWNPPLMQRLSRQVLIRMVIVFAMAVGLLRPPFGSDAYADNAAVSHTEALEHADGAAKSHHHHSGAGHTHDDDSASQHDASDHSHIPSSLPPSITGLALSSDWTRLADLETVGSPPTAISFDRPPRPTVFT